MAGYQIDKREDMKASRVALMYTASDKAINRSDK